MAELRRDPVSGNWVIVGYEVVRKKHSTVCPFCPGNENLTTEAVREYRNTAGDWQIRCFPALNSVFTIETAQDKQAEGIYDKMGNVGAHEIIVDHREHGKLLSTFTKEELSLLTGVYQERIVDLKQDKRFRYVLAFRNSGELAGSLIAHPHSHILATPIMPKRIDLELANSRRRFLQKERCLFCDIVRQEIREGRRIVQINESFVALCPFASRFPFETWILPRHHHHCFEDLKDHGVMADFVAILSDVTRKIERRMPAYSLLVHTSPNATRGTWYEDDASVNDYFHWHVEILPKDVKIAKYKTEDEFYVIPFTPEEAASLLKE
jgi:UDPglucose--hexose-1-phosphate uridylyltransferase